MTALQVFLDVPETLITGLSTGSLERIGGVIREADTKQVVAWLREGISDTSESGLPAPLTQVLAATNNAGISAVLGTVVLTSLLNFSVSLISLRIMMNRLDQLGAQIESLREMIKTEFKRERDMRFKVALQAARDVFEGEEHTVYSETAARSAIDGLYEARENYLDELNSLIQTGVSVERRILAHHYLMRAMYAEVSRIRCYLTRSMDMAIKRLAEDIPRFRDLTVSLVKLWLGEKHAAYLYREMSQQHVQRFIAIKRWLSSPDDPFVVNPHTHLMDVMEELRPDFWNTEISRLFEGGIRLPWDRPPYSQAVLAENLTQAEIAIENFQHLQGFELELRSIRLTSADWESIVTETEATQSAFSVIVDTERLSV